MVNEKANHFLSHPIFWWSIIIFISIFIYFLGISHESIWWDESYSSFMASYPPIPMFYPPFTFLITDAP